MNQALREAPRERLSTAIEWALAGRTPDWKGIEKSLEREGIAVVIDKSKAGDERVFFVDHSSKSAFEGKNLGEAYRLEALHNRCRPTEDVVDELIQKQQLHMSL